MSNNVFQNVIAQLQEVSDRTFGVLDTEGCVISCTDPALLGQRWQDAALKVANSTEQVVTFGQKTFRSIVSSAGFFEYAVFCTGTDETAKISCQMAHIALNGAKTYYEEKHDRGTLRPTRPGRCFWFASWVTVMWPRWMYLAECSRIRIRILW